MNNLGTKSSRAIVWSALDRIATQGIQFVVMLYLARNLGPNAFGTIGMLTVILSIGQLLSDGGISVALLRKVDASDADYNSAFLFNFLSAICIWAMIFLLAPLVADFYKYPDLKITLRVLSLNIILTSLTLSQRTVLASRLEFKMISTISIISVLVGSTIAVILLNFYNNEWVLVAQQLSTSLSTLILCNLLAPWRPKFYIKKESLIELWNTAKNIIGAGLLDVTFSNLYNVAIGRKLTTTDLGHFTQANQLTLTPSSTLSFIINRVAFSTLSKVQDQPKRFSKIFEKILNISLLIIFPLMFILILNSKDLIVLALGGDWIDIAPLVSILGFGYLFYPFHLLNITAIQVKGNTQLFLKIELIKKALSIFIFILTFSNGILHMCIGLTGISLICIFINSYYSEKVTGMSQTHQLKILLSALTLNLIPILLSLIFKSEKPLINILIKTLLYITSYLPIIFVVRKELALETLRLLLPNKPAKT